VQLLECAGLTALWILLVMKQRKNLHELVSDRHRSVYQQLLASGHNANQVDRRDFLKLLSASIALAGLAGCSAKQPVEKIIPYVKQPENIVPGKPQFYATAMTLGGYAIGLLAESHEGRPTKIEGNPNHPASLGATDVFAQASILDLYDPDRSQTPLYLGEIRSWGDFLSDFQREIAKQRDKRGAGLRILTETVSSPTLADQLQKLLTDFPQAKWHQWEPCNRDNELLGARTALGQFVETIYHFDKARVVLSIDADFLMNGPASVRYSRDFMNGRRVRQDRVEMNRLYVVECTPSNTGFIADHRLSIMPSQIEGFVHALASTLGGNASIGVPAVYQQWITAVARDLQLNRGASIVVAGSAQPPSVHAFVHQINQTLGNVGSTITYTKPVSLSPTIQLESLRQLVNDMSNGQVELLVMLGGNPVYNAPADLYFADNLQKVHLRIHHNLYYDETSALCHWHINAAHYLESWSDARAFDGTVSIVQPLIAPLYSGKTEHEMLAAVSNQPDQTSYDIVRKYWQSERGAASVAAPSAPTRSPTSTTHTKAAPNANRAANPTVVLPVQAAREFEDWWTKSLRDGVIEGTAGSGSPFNPTASKSIAPQIANASAANTVEVIFRPDPSIYDGRFANNGWLQELPKPLTKLAWDNAAIISPNTAQRLALIVEANARGGEHGANDVSLIEISANGRSIRAPVWILPGQPDDVVTLHLGYGRTRAGSRGTSTADNPVGFNAYQLRTSNALWSAVAEIKRTAEFYQLACTQAHASMEGRELIRSATLDDYRNRPEFAKREADKPHDQISMYPGWNYDKYAWGMSIDTGTCMGCNACVVACQSENNIPVVGKQEVMHAREMHWVRIDRYLEGDGSRTFQPVPCMQCENAPCELVCPVEATTHSDEGLNEMTYNRCVGTRYCSNNCPYKVRRFNFFEYGNFDQPLLKLQHNPEVTVRSRGVMEKCTYCVQRITGAKIESEKENRRVADGEITPACQQACPVQAIVFGDINDPNSRVSKLKGEATDYGMLAELNTRPRTTYLAKIRNSNPEIMETR
jgi:Fe-S-cluster-containing dehydrogenase component